MKFDEAKVIVDELWKDQPDLVVFGVNEFNNPTLSVSYGTNNKDWFNKEKGQHGWDLWIDNRFITYRMYALDIRLEPVKMKMRSIMLSKLQPDMLRSFLMGQLALAAVAQRK